MLSVPYMLIAYPMTRLYVGLVLSRSPFSPSRIEEAAYLGVNVITFTTAAIVLGQLSFMLEYAIRRDLAKARTDAYNATVASRGKRM